MAKRFSIFISNTFANNVLFSEDNLTIATEKGIKLITRMPDNTLVAKDSINEVVRQLDLLQKITFENSKEKGAVYRVLEKTCKYAGHTLSLAVCYSESIQTLMCWGTWIISGGIVRNHIKPMII